MNRFAGGALFELGGATATSTTSWVRNQRRKRREVFAHDEKTALDRIQ